MVHCISYNDNREVYKVGKFAFDADGSDVIVTKDTKCGIITINLYQYKDHERACDAAYRMAMLQSKA